MGSLSFILAIQLLREHQFLGYSMSGITCSTISFIVDRNNISIFSPILQQGFKIFVNVGCSLKSLLCDQLGVTPEYLSDRIKTIFINGKPVDNVETAIINDGAVIALSAAMPGLVGASFGSDSPLSALRSSITYSDEDGKSNITDRGMVTLKLFNLLISEMGHNFLENGIMVETGIMKSFFEEKEVNWETVFKSVIINGQEIESNEINLLKWSNNQEIIHVKVEIE